jgi:hypothetical protein
MASAEGQSSGRERMDSNHRRDSLASVPPEDGHVEQEPSGLLSLQVSTDSSHSLDQSWRRSVQTLTALVVC